MLHPNIPPKKPHNNPTASSINNNQERAQTNLQLPSAKDHIRRDVLTIAAILAGQAQLLHQASASSGLGGNTIDSIKTPDGLGNDKGLRISIPAQDSNDSTITDSGFPDPLSGLGNSKPHNTVVGPAAVPGSRSLVNQDGDGSSGTLYDNGSDHSHGSVWAERHTERSSSDGTQTWGSTTYRDYSGNYWRVDYHDQRTGGNTTTTSDDHVVSKSTVFDSQGNAIKTTVVVENPDGTGTETTTDHSTGNTTTVDITPKEPEPTADPKKGEPDEEGNRSANPAPRGWYDPISGVSQNPGLPTSNNQVNPGPEDSHTRPAPLKPFHFDHNILVTDPPPDQPISGSAGVPDINAGTPTIIDPPHPDSGS